MTGGHPRRLGPGPRDSIDYMLVVILALILVASISLIAITVLNMGH